MCVKTLLAWQCGKLPNGKANIVFSPPKGGKGTLLHLPCGQCIECRLERSRIWAMRCMHEASLYDSNCFITLTFNDDHCNPANSLQKDHFQLFMKRLRKFLDNNYWDSSENKWIKLVIPFSYMCQQKYSGIKEVAQPVRYFHAGEYGENFGRPHHHAILFGFDFPDKILKTHRRGFNYYESETLTKLWSDPESGASYGFHEITSCSFETCAYVARYVCKKVNGDAAKDHYLIIDESGYIHDRLPEFCTMSRRPGIGAGWYEKYSDTDCWAHDQIHLKGSVYSKPPRYYGAKYELTNPAEYEIIKANRLKKSLESTDNNFDRQKVKEVVKKAQSNFLKRNL